MNKRGDVSDIVVFLIIVTFLAVSFIVVLFANEQLLKVIQLPSLNSSSTSTIVSAFNTINTTVVQRGFVLMIGILIMGIIASSFLVKIHPAFIFIYIIVLAFTLFVSVFLANMYEKVISVEQLATIAAQQPMITFFMQNLVTIVLAVGALSMIVIFAKLTRPSTTGGFGEEGIG